MGLSSHAMKVIRELPGNNSYALQFQCVRKLYPENCTIQDWKDSVDKAWHKEADEEIDQLKGSPIMALMFLPKWSSQYFLV